MDTQVEFVNRYLKKQTDLIAELLTLKLQTETRLEVSELVNADLQTEVDELKAIVASQEQTIAELMKPVDEQEWVPVEHPAQKIEF